MLNQDPGKMKASCDHRNELQPTFDLDLKQDQWVAVTYGCHLRVGVLGQDPYIDMKGLPELAYLSAPENLSEPVRLFLYLYHGRDTVDEDMDDWGDDARDQPNYPGDPTADAFVITEAGITAVDYHIDGSRTETLIPYVNGLIEYRGRYYGDFSIEHVGNKGYVPAKES